MELGLFESGYVSFLQPKDFLSYYKMSTSQLAKHIPDPAC